MDKAKVLLAHVPRILGDVLTHILEGQPDIAVVGEVDTLDDLPRAVARLRPAAVILTPLPRTGGRWSLRILWDRCPELLVVEIDADHDRVVVRSADGRSRHLELSAAGIVQAVRSAAGQPRPDR